MGAMAPSPELQRLWEANDIQRALADAADIKRVCEASQELTFLEAPFARAAKKLPPPKHDLKAISVKMGGSGGVAAAAEPFLAAGGAGDEEDEDDLT